MSVEREPVLNSNRALTFSANNLCSRRGREGGRGREGEGEGGREGGRGMGEGGRGREREGGRGRERESVR